MFPRLAGAGYTPFPPYPTAHDFSFTLLFCGTPSSDTCISFNPPKYPLSPPQEDVEEASDGSSIEQAASPLP